MIDSQTVRQLNIGTIIESLRSQQREGYSDEKLFDQAVVLFRELNVGQLLQHGRIFAGMLLQDFELNEATADLKRLSNLGVREETIFVALLLFAFMPYIDTILQGAFGDMKERKRKAKTLLEAAAIMDEFAGNTPSFVELTVQNNPSLKSIPIPREPADALHLYANVLFIRDQLRKALDVNTGEELAKYTLAGAIHRITGKYHDREASAVFGVLLRKPDYDETAHRVWRIRTFRRLNRSCAYLPIILHAMNAVLAESAG